MSELESGSFDLKLHTSLNRSNYKIVTLFIKSKHDCAYKKDWRSFLISFYYITSSQN